MTEDQRNHLHIIWQECDNNDDSTEYMIARMIDETGLEHDEIIRFLIKEGTND